MRKLFLFIAALTLSVGMWAETVSYLCPVYNDTQNVTKGIQRWETKTADATEITNASATLAAGWYVVKGTDVQTGTLTCQGAVHIILADGAKLTATGNGDQYNPYNSTPGIQVSGTGNSLTIYAQSMGDQMGQLKATCGFYAAGIGSGYEGKGSNITINGGIVTATGGFSAAGIGGGLEGAGKNITINGGTVIATGGSNGAGIGGGNEGSGSNITINGGTVEANGGYYGGAGIGGGTNNGIGSYITINGGEVIATGGIDGAGIGGGAGGNGTNITITGGTVIATGGNNASGIGGGKGGSGSNIKVATYLIVKAGNEENPEEIATDRTDDTDIASSLAGKRYATTEINFSKYKTIVIAAVNAEITESDNDNVKAIATSAATAINAATTIAEVNTLKSLAIANITSAKAAYTDGKEAGKAAGLAEAAAALPTDPEGTTGHTVTITKGDKTLILVNPDKVTYGKQE